MKRKLAILIVFIMALSPAIMLRAQGGNLPTIAFEQTTPLIRSVEEFSRVSIDAGVTITNWGDTTRIRFSWRHMVTGNIRTLRFVDINGVSIGEQFSVPLSFNIVQMRDSGSYILYAWDADTDELIGRIGEIRLSLDGDIIEEEYEEEEYEEEEYEEEEYEEEEYEEEEKEDETEEEEKEDEEETEEEIELEIPDFENEILTQLVPNENEEMPEYVILAIPLHIEYFILSSDVIHALVENNTGIFLTLEDGSTITIPVGLLAYLLYDIDDASITISFVELPNIEEDEIFEEEVVDEEVEETEETEYEEVEETEYEETEETEYEETEETEYEETEEIEYEETDETDETEYEEIEAMQDLNLTVNAQLFIYVNGVSVTDLDDNFIIFSIPLSAELFILDEESEELIAVIDDQDNLIFGIICLETNTFTFETNTLGKFTIVNFEIELEEEE